METPHETDARDERPQQNREPIGPSVGIVIIIALMIIGGIYLWFSQVKNLQQIRDQEGAVIQVGEASGDEIATTTASTTETKTP